MKLFRKLLLMVVVCVMIAPIVHVTTLYAQPEKEEKMLPYPTPTDRTQQIHKSRIQKESAIASVESADGPSVESNSVGHGLQKVLCIFRLGNRG